MTVATGLRIARPASVPEIEAGAGAVLLAGGTEVIPQLEDGLIEADTLVDIAEILPREVSATRIGAGATLAELEGSEDVPAALREACRLAASPQLRNMATVGGNLLQSTRCWYWRLQYPCRLHGGDVCHAREGEHREHAIFANDVCASAHPSDVAAALLALGATVRTSSREVPLAALYRLPEPDDVRLVTLEPGEILLELELPPCDASVYLKAMDRKRFGFPVVGVAAARRGDETTIALAGVAPVPWLLDGSLDEATPLPGNTYKVEVARALLSRALASIEAR
ncbi:MAG TPA: FAD binding domain-containing protein [Gaiellaceae bacterium]|jgi:xanthine dehydrogenase YagS FAD-binding subunit|nr:FAD binding domain-containing protein [Gaiellaceae bacterium]